MILYTSLYSVLWRCWLDGRKGIWPVKTEWWGAGVVICLERGADLHMAQLIPLPLTVCCFSKIPIGFYLSGRRLTRVVPEKGPLNGCVCVCVCVCVFIVIYYYVFIVPWRTSCVVSFVLSLRLNALGLMFLTCIVRAFQIRMILLPRQ